MKQYIGVTGFTKPQEVRAALEAFPTNSTRQLMVGVLVSWESLRGIPLNPKWQKRYPDPCSLADLFPNDSRVVNLVHYNTEKGQESSILLDMLEIHDLARPNFHGFQLNIPWPGIGQMARYRMAMGNNYRIVLQIGQKAVEIAGGTPQGVIDMLDQYIGIINDVLFDLSGGLGKPLDTERACKFLAAIAEQGWNLGIGVAGGLGPNTLHLVEPLLTKFPDLSIDAEGRLRNADGDLDIEAMKTYLTNASQMFARK